MRRSPIALLLTALALFGARSAVAQPTGPEAFAEGRPPIVETLGEDRAVRLTGVNEADGRVVWFNWRLAEEMGIRGPRGDVLTPDYERELMRSLSWRLLREGESAAGRRTVDMFADRYGGWGMGYNKGAGRAAFFGDYNLNIKGVGVTPLVSGATHYSHRHGGAPLKEGILEAVWGEVGTNLFQSGSTRILAVIDIGDYTEWEDGGRERRALIIRAGHQLRPAHLLAEGFTRPQNFEALTRMMDATGTLVRTERGGREVIDLDEGLRRLANDHARTAAELYRYRILHGGLSPGNKSFDGGMLDLGTVTSQPRTAPVHVLDYADGSGGVRSDLRFETENEWRERDLSSYRSILREAAGKPEYRYSDPDVTALYREAYQRHMELQLLEATGLKPEVAEALRGAQPDLVREYVETIRGLGRRTNAVEMNIERHGVERGSVVDVFNALRHLPAESLAGGASAERVFEHLKADADDPRALEEVRAEAERLGRLHREVLEGAFAAAGERYDGREGFERSVRERALFENAPLDQLHRSSLSARLEGEIARYSESGDPESLRGLVEELASASRRDVESLLTSGRSQPLAEGGLLSGERTVDGLTYGVRSAADGARTVRVELPLVEVAEGYRLPSVQDWALARSAANDVVYRYTLDGWASEGEASGRVGEGRGGGKALLFDVPVAGGSIGVLEGAFHVREGNWWIKRNGGNFGGYRFAVPDGADLARLRARIGEGRNGPGFGPRRRGAAALLEHGWAPREVSSVFEAVRVAAAERGLERVGEGIDRSSAEERAAARAAASRAGSAELVVERSAEIDARYDRAGNRVWITDGLLGAIEGRAAALPEAERTGFKRRALGLVLGHELAHASGIVAERVADREGLETLRRLTNVSEADARRTLEALRVPGSERLSLLERLRSLTTYGTERGRAEALAAAARGEADPLARYRRADGTLEWSRVTRDRALREVGGVAHFGLALFLKELAVVAQTGDRARIEEFFDSLLTTDFYKEYGLFVLGARAGEVAYSRYLEKFVKPRFVSGVLKTNLVLATGLALPQIVGGHFNGKAFAISLGSLGLSSAAVKAGAAGIRWVYDLNAARNSGLLARVGLAGRAAKIGGWLYTAAELAVVLYLSEEIDQRVNAWLDLREARGALGDAGASFLRAVNDPRATPEAVREATEAYHGAWGDYRNFLYSPLARDEALFAERMGRAARDAKLAEDRRAAALARLDAHPALRRNIERRYGSVAAYAEHLTREDTAKIDRDVATYVDSYEDSRAEHLRAVYEDHRREGPFLADVDDLDWHLAGAPAGAAGDPYAGRSDVLARWGRDRSRGAFSSALGDASRNRLQTYDDEAALLRATAAGLRRSGRAAAAAEVEAVLELTTRTRDVDASLFRGDGLADLSGRAATGASATLERSTSRD